MRRWRSCCARRPAVRSGWSEMALDADTLVAALGRWTARLERAAPELNALDGQLGDGNLGATLEKCAVNVRKALAAPPADIGGLFRACAVPGTKASGSSLGPLPPGPSLTAGRPTARQRGLAWRERSGRP